VPASSIRRILPVIHVTILQCPSKMLDLAEVLVVPVPLAGQHRVQRMMKDERKMARMIGEELALNLEHLKQILEEKDA
jgi:hypothetical protein